MGEQGWRRLFLCIPAVSAFVSHTGTHAHSDGAPGPIVKEDGVKKGASVLEARSAVSTQGHGPRSHGSW